MIRFLFTSVLLMTVTLVTWAGQEIKDAPKKEEGKKADGPGASIQAKEATPKIVPDDVEIRFRNGSIIRMIVQTEKLDIATSYGTLAVPVKDLRAIEFGLHYPAGVEAQIEAAVQKLGSAEFRERDKAGKMLVGWGPLAYPAVFAARHSTDPGTDQNNRANFEREGGATLVCRRCSGRAARTAAQLGTRGKTWSLGRPEVVA